jgi:uncharacterized iron-regulated membrane protein
MGGHLMLGRHLTRRVVRQLHLWIGLALCLPLLMLGVTGSLLVFEDELRSAFTAPPQQARSGEARSIDEIVAAARQAAPNGYSPASYAAPGEPGGLAAVRLVPAARGASGSERLRVDVDPATLDTFGNSETGFFRQVFFLHSTLLLRNREGRQLVGWLGVAMLVMGISGLVNWWPRRGGWRSAFAATGRASGFQLHREWHGAAGIWGLAVFLTVTFGGVYLAFPESVRSVVDLAMPASDLRGAANAVRVEPARGAERLGIDAAVALAREAFPDAALRFVFLQTKPHQPIRVGLLRQGEERRSPVTTVFVDPWARRVVDTFDPRRFTLGERILAWQHAVHAGQGLGPVWKVLVFLCGLLPLLFSVTGLAMWQLKRRRRPAATTVSTPLIDQTYTARRTGE